MTRWYADLRKAQTRGLALIFLVHIERTCGMGRKERKRFAVYQSTFEIKNMITIATIVQRCCRATSTPFDTKSHVHGNIWIFERQRHVVHLPIFW
jgi:hypothetical protein